MARIDELLARVKEQKGSDLHLAAGVTPRLRLRGELTEAQGWKALDDASLRELLREVTTPEQWHTFEQENDLDFAYALAGVGRFRANFLVQRHGAIEVARRHRDGSQIPEENSGRPAVAELPEDGDAFLPQIRGAVELALEIRDRRQLVQRDGALAPEPIGLVALQRFHVSGGSVSEGSAVFGDLAEDVERVGSRGDLLEEALELLDDAGARLVEVQVRDEDDQLRCTRPSRSPPGPAARSGGRPS